jgi:MoaA/NifB/PqqE/SkfB family radical SAM enzyme
MAERFVELPFLRNVGLMMTYKCQVTCPHCIVQAGPHRQEEMLVHDGCEWIRQIAAYRNSYIKVVALTGGEPFYNLDNLRAVSDCAAASGLLTSVVTNAFWASTPEQALAVLKELPSIRILSISTDIYHQVAIPLTWVKNAALAAEACSIAYSISVCTENEEEKGYLEIIDKLLEFTSRELILTAIALPVGRALRKLNKAKYSTTAEVPISACATGSSPVIFPNGRVIGCIGPVIDLESSHPLALGNLREDSLGEILETAQSNSILHAIRAWGPKKLIPMIRDAGLGHFLPDRYIKDSVCDACYNIMANAKIVEFLNEVAADSEFRRTVAYARAYYLQEPEMVECMGLP